MENLLLVIFVSVLAGQLVRGSDPQPPDCPLGKHFKAPVINDCTAYWDCDDGEITKKYCGTAIFIQKKFDSIDLQCKGFWHKVHCYVAPVPTLTPPPSSTPSMKSSTSSSTTPSSSSPSSTPSSSSPSSTPSSTIPSTTPSPSPPSSSPNPSSSTTTTGKPGGASSIAPLGWVLMSLLVAAPTFVSR